MWYMYDFIDKKDINRIEMLLTDEKGDQIHAIIYKKFVSSYDKTLQEGVFLIYRFYVEHQQGNYHPCDHKYRITFKWDKKDKDDSSQTTINSKVKQIDAIGPEEAPNYKLKNRNLRKIIYDGNNEYEK
ncbi:hypothetical protein GIB67_019690 [Kingdonia uniflora]|uniref:Replication protein A 70 kDa DNA-binding subunit B/D first OB fold domain-containing protein n=1 Tax=Kingdonia uniflora TaxID=39325 RepID=A0A7J7MK46_9MAGN|nr:hypothetical protein GIB67_019690 [Kingdonia uniflora]